MIGGADKYMATCRRCFKSNVKIPVIPRRNGTCNKVLEMDSKKDDCSENGSASVEKITKGLADLEHI